MTSTNLPEGVPRVTGRVDGNTVLVDSVSSVKRQGYISYAGEARAFQ